LAGFGLVAIAVYADRRGFSLFTGLAESELSPLTPLILMALAIALFLLLHGSAENKMTITTADLPVLSLLLVVLSLYDAFDKSLISLLILFAGGVIARRTSRHSDVDGVPQNPDTLTDELRTTWDLAFGNRIVPFALLVLMIFAIGHDLSSTFANEMQVQLLHLRLPDVLERRRAVRAHVPVHPVEDRLPESGGVCPLSFPYLSLRDRDR
jgi:hypothetical protein